MASQRREGGSVDNLHLHFLFRGGCDSDDFKLAGPRYSITAEGQKWMILNASPRKDAKPNSRQKKQKREKNRNKKRRKKEDKSPNGDDDDDTDLETTGI